MGLIIATYFASLESVVKPLQYSWGCLELTQMTFMTAARDDAVKKVNIDHTNIKIIKGLLPIF